MIDVAEILQKYVAGLNSGNAKNARLSTAARARGNSRTSSLPAARV